MIKKIILAGFIFLYSTVQGFSQFNITIADAVTPDTHSCLEGEFKHYNIIVTYTAPLPFRYQFVATVNNGSIISQNLTPVWSSGQRALLTIDIRWNCLVSTGGNFTITETRSGIFSTYNTFISSYITDPNNYCSVATLVKQNLNYGQTPTSLNITNCGSFCTNSNDVTYQYQWQVGNVAIGAFPQVPTSWTDITSATSINYQPPTYSIDCIKAYRRLTTFTIPGTNTSVTKQSTVAVISTFDYLNGGSISGGTTFNNGVPVITQTPATGGMCDGFNYIYTWEVSSDQTNWTVIGTGPNPDFPAGVQIPGSCTVRRKVFCNNEIQYSNALNINPQPLNPGKISGGGTYSFNIVPSVTQNPASGSACNAPDYVYTWERSVNNGSTWVVFGTNTAIYPSGAGIIGTCKIRRKVHCVYEEAYTNEILFTMLPYTSPNVENLNYIRVNDIAVPGVQSWPQADVLPTGDKIQTTDYFDNLNRSVQSVIKEGSFQSGTTTYVDMVKAHVYDVFGREQYNYLPFVANNSGGNTSISDGKFKLNPLAQEATFAQTQYPGDNFYYSKTNFESSPSSRVTDTYAPGNSWAGSESNSDPAQRRNVKFLNVVNSLNDEVQIWIVTNNSNNTTQGQFGSYSSLGVYPAGQLYKNIVADEQGVQTIEFKDKIGNTVLTKKQLTATTDNGTGAGHDGWICTYYVYDDLNILRAVFQPKAVEWLKNHSWSFTSVPSEGNQVLSEFVFKYEYDLHKHLIKKQLPGQAEIWMVYDGKDRIVLTQDGNEHINHQWSYIQYDDANRPLTTGLITDNTYYNDLNYHLQQGSANIIYPNLSSTQFATQELIRKFYDDYKWRSLWGNPLSDVFNHNYDAYLLQASNSTWPYPNSITPNKCSVHGQNTGTLTKILGKPSSLFSVVFYDENGRVIQSQSQNISGGTDIATTQYSWSGYPLVTILKQQNGGTISPKEHIVKTSFQYDKLFRNITISKMVKSNINGLNVSSPDVIILQNKYDALGRLINKSLGQKKDASGNYTTTPIETLALDFNIRGWLLGVNRAYIKNQSNNYFGFELGYENINNIIAGQSYAKSQYTGQITGTTWRGISDNEVRKYDFDYDLDKRLLKADFKQFDGSSFVTSSVVNYSMKMGDGITPGSAYDVNGNILLVQQYGLKLNASPLIDNLNYTYQNEGRSNKLQNVIDRENDAVSKLGDFHTSAQHPQASLKQNLLTNPNTIIDYDYDANGNLKFDYNKDIANGSNNAIEYNHLNLPTKVTLLSGTKGTVEYVYDANGGKLQKITTDYTTASKKIITTNTYIAGFVYESKQTLTLPSGPPDPSDYTDRLLYFQHEEGRVRLNEITATTTNPFCFDYFVKDHLGNVRIILTDEQEQDTYPAATLEGDLNNSNTAVGFEKGFYTINSANVVDNSEAIGINTIANTYYNNNGILNPYPTGNSGNANVGAASTKLYKLLASSTGGGQTGLGITLKVMSGDKINIFGKSYYFDNNTSQQNYSIPVTDIIGGLFGAPSSVAGIKGITATQVNNEPVLSGLVNGFLADPNRNNNGASTTPKAYINWILFDENFKMVAGNFSRVHTASQVYDHHNDPNLQDIPVTKSGYLYVYVSNESPVKVFFDNLQIVHKRGAVLEENHYYPYGLLMTGLSSKAATKIENFCKYNGKEIQKNEFSDGTGLEWYDYGMREYDQQISRFFRLDPLAEKFSYLTPYQYASNNPVSKIDLDGLEGIDINSSFASAQIWNSAGFSQSGGVTYFDEESELGKYYSETGWIDGAMKSMMITSFAMDIGGLLMTRPLAGMIAMQAGTYEGEMTMAFVRGGATSTVEIRAMEIAIIGAEDVGVSIEAINELGVVEATERAIYSKAQQDLMFESRARMFESNNQKGMAQAANYRRLSEENMNDVLYRGDNKSMESAFQEGFYARGANRSVLDHAKGWKGDSYYIPTSTDFNVASEWAQGYEAEGSIFHIRHNGNGIDVNSYLGLSSPNPGEMEIAIPNHIPNTDIIGASNPFSGKFTPNPYFRWP